MIADGKKETVKIQVMIKPNELRIGNYIIPEDKSINLFRIDAIIYDEGNYMAEMYVDFPEKNQNLSLQLQKATGVQLTKEILHAVGFKYSGNHFYEYKEDCLILFEEPNNWDDISNYVIGIEPVTSNYITGFVSFGEIIIRCVYLHELQNYFFAITGKELNCNFI